MLAVLCGCSRPVPAKTPWSRGHRELTESVAVRQAEPIDASSFLLTVASDGMRFDGKKIEAGPAAFGRYEAVDGHGLRQQPLLIECRGNDSLGTVGKAVDPFLQKGFVNMSFLVDRGGQPAALPFPLMFDKIIWRSGRRQSPYYTKPRVPRLEIRIGPARGENVSILELNVAAWTTHYAPDEEEIRAEAAWEGVHPALGSWTEETLRTFLDRDDIRQLDPYIRLWFKESDAMSEVLVCLSIVNSMNRLAFM